MTGLVVHILPIMPLLCRHGFPTFACALQHRIILRPQEIPNRVPIRLPLRPDRHRAVHAAAEALPRQEPQRVRDVDDRGVLLGRDVLPRVGVLVEDLQPELRRQQQGQGAVVGVLVLAEELLVGRALVADQVQAAGGDGAVAVEGLEAGRGREGERVREAGEDLLGDAPRGVVVAPEEAQICGDNGREQLRGCKSLSGDLQREGWSAY